MRLADMHVHSTFSDGENTPEEIVSFCITEGYQAVGVVDHVRRNSRWVEDLCCEVSRLKHKYGDQILILGGIEAKVVGLDGTIDAQPEWPSWVDLTLAAFHRIPSETGFLSDDAILSDRDLALLKWRQALFAALRKPGVGIIAHITEILDRYDIAMPLEMKCDIAVEAHRQRKVIEVNTRYGTPDEEFLAILMRRQVRLSIGSDSHSINDMIASRGLLRQYIMRLKDAGWKAP